MHFDGGIVDGHRQQFIRIAKAGRKLVETHDDLLELCTFLPERLRALGLVPDVRLLEFALNLGQALRLAFVVKDTSSTRRCVRQGRLSSV